jgi:hypothetical protein
MLHLNTENNFVCYSLAVTHSKNTIIEVKHAVSDSESTAVPINSDNRRFTVLHQT